MTVDDLTSGAPVRSAFMLPGAPLRLAVMGRGPYRLRDRLGHEQPARQGGWTWHAPTEPGWYPLVILGRRGDSVLVNVFVLVPFDALRGGRLNGYRVGEYPAFPLRDLDIYRRPAGFVELTRDNQHVAVSPSFRLGQFPARQASDFPKYLVLEESLLVLLERILDGLREAGYAVSTLHIRSGYRTPHYHRAMGNPTRFSRHLWGAAADILVDESPPDGVMDDLNGDGVIDERDAAVLARVVEDVSRDPQAPFLQGGLRVYGPDSTHGPFVHVDVRGFEARW